MLLSIAFTAHWIKFFLSKFDKEVRTRLVFDEKGNIVDNKKLMMGNLWYMYHSKITSFTDVKLFKLYDAYYFKTPNLPQHFVIILVCYFLDNNCWVKGKKLFEYFKKYFGTINQICQVLNQIAIKVKKYEQKQKTKKNWFNDTLYIFTLKNTMTIYIFLIKTILFFENIYICLL